MGICSRRLLALLTVLVVGLFAPISTTWARPSLQEAAYTIVEFGVPTASEARAINEEGIAAGFAENAETRTRRALTLDNATLRDLTPEGEASDAWGINDAGQIAGVGYHDGEKRGFVLTPANS